MKFYFINVAGFNFRLQFFGSRFKYAQSKLMHDVLKHYHSFLIKKIPHRIDFYIDFIWENDVKILFIEKEKENFINFARYKTNNRICCYYRMTIIEFHILFADILLKLFDNYNGFIAHASAILKDDQAFIFLGLSGAGKSTIVKLLSDKYQVLADDSVIIRKLNNEYYLFQTPFFEKEFNFKKNINGFPLKKIFLLSKSKHTFLKKLTSRKKVLPFLLINNHAHIIYNPKNAQTARILEFVSKFNNFNKLNFAKDKQKILSLFKQQ